MPLPQILDAAREHLFTDVSGMTAAGVPRATIDHILRLRTVYVHWLETPSLLDREIVAMIKSQYGLSDTKARQDLRLVKLLLGDLQQTTKDYHRHRFVSMIEETFALAREKGNLGAMVEAAGKYAKYTQLDKPDDRDAMVDAGPPQSFEFTDNPEVLGLKRVPGIKEIKKKLLDRYMSDDIVDIKAEEVEWNPDSIFDNIPAYGGAIDIPEEDIPQ